MGKMRFVNMRDWLSWFLRKREFTPEEQAQFYEELDQKNLINFRFLNMAILIVILLFIFIDAYLSLDQETHFRINITRFLFIFGFIIPFIVYSFSNRVHRISQGLLFLNAMGYGIFLLVLSAQVHQFPIAVAHNTVALYLVNISLYLLFGLRQKYALVLSTILLLAININYHLMISVQQISVSAADLNIWFIIVTIIGALSGKHIDNLLEKSFRVNLELKKVNESKYQLFSMVSHDLKNMISAQYTITDCLTEQAYDMKDEDKDRMIDILHKSATDVVSVFEDLMTWIKTQINAIAPLFKDISIKSFNQTILDQMQPLATAKNIELKLISDQTEMICTDANILGLILRNVIGNAIKFSTEHSLVTIESKVIQGVFNYYISDEGMGMSQEKIDNLFNIDKAESKPGTKGEKGTGLGLLLTKELLTYLNGEIVIESKLNQGTRVFLSFPVNCEKQ